MLLVHWARRAASRAAWTAGSKSAINTAIIAITTRSSISVKPTGLRTWNHFLSLITRLLSAEHEKG